MRLSGTSTANGGASTVKTLNLRFVWFFGKSIVFLHDVSCKVLSGALTELNK